MSPKASGSHWIVGIFELYISIISSSASAVTVISNKIIPAFNGPFDPKDAMKPNAKPGGDGTQRDNARLCALTPSPETQTSGPCHCTSPSEVEIKCRDDNLMMRIMIDVYQKEVYKYII